MERHQVGQEHTLVELHLERERLDLIPQPRASPADRRCCFQSAVALCVMGLVIVGLGVAFILQLFSCPGTSNKDLGSQRFNQTISITCDQTKHYDDTLNIFTINKTATYLIYGRVRRPSTKGKIFLDYTWNQEKMHSIGSADFGEEASFFKEVHLYNKSMIKLSFNEATSCKEIFFHIYEL